MKSKKSLKEMLIDTGYIQPQGKGELRPIKLDDAGVIVSDEIEADEEQKKINAARIKKAIKVMARGK